MPCGSGRGGTNECATQRQTKVLTSQQVDAFERNGLRRTVSVLRANKVLDLFRCDLPGTRVPSALGTHACPILGPLDSSMTLARTIGSEGPGWSRSSTRSSRPPRRPTPSHRAVSWTGPEPTDQVTQNHVEEQETPGDRHRQGRSKQRQ